MLLFPALSGAQALSYTAAETDAASLGTAGANLAQTHSIAGAAFSNVAAVPFSDAKFHSLMLSSMLPQVLRCGSPRRLNPI